MAWSIAIHPFLVAAVVVAIGCVHDRATVVDDGGSGGVGVGGAGASTTASVVSSTVASAGGAGGIAGGCGDGVLDLATEQCDDGNMAPQDGCDASCTVECTAGWSDAATHHCYLLVANAATWLNARAFCMALDPGYDLAAVSSDPEHQFVVSQLPLMSPLRIWLGGNDQLVEGTFEWSNGEPWGFTVWATGEPNDAMGENCMELRINGTVWDWNDIACDSPIATAFLCELTPAGSGP